MGLEAAEGKVAQRDEQWEGLQQDLQEATVWLAVWEAMVSGWGVAPGQW